MVWLALLGTILPAKPTTPVFYRLQPRENYCSLIGVSGGKERLQRVCLTLLFLEVLKGGRIWEEGKLREGSCMFLLMF